VIHTNTEVADHPQVGHGVHNLAADMGMTIDHESFGAIEQSRISPMV